MPRPISWLPRLQEIRRSVANSVRSHYDRKDLQSLFQLQPRAAAALMDMMPTVKIGQALLAERAALSRFLDRMHRAENVATAVKEQRAEREATTRRKPRILVRRDHDAIPAAALKQWLTRGELRIPFDTAQELADVLWRVAMSLQEDQEAFIALYEPVTAAEPDPARDEVRELFERLREIEEARRQA